MIAWIRAAVKRLGVTGRIDIVMYCDVGCNRRLQLEPRRGMMIGMDAARRSRYAVFSRAPCGGETDMGFDISGPTRVSEDDGYEDNGKLWPFLMNRQWAQVFIADSHHDDRCNQHRDPDSNYCDPRPTCGAVIQDIVDIISDVEEIDFLMPGMR